MEAISFNAQTKELKLTRKDIPDKIGDNEVLVKVHYAGICGTDLHIIDGEFPCRQDEPIVLGHEFSGIAVKIGANITHVAIGDKVVADPNKGCYKCEYCRSGTPNYCKTAGLNGALGIFVNGGWGQYCVVPDVQIHKVPQHLSLETVALCEPISCISHAWDRIIPVGVSKKILILGSGIIGNLFTSLLHYQGYRHVTISEPSPFRAQIVQKLDTGYEIITPDQLAKDTKLYDVIIDCSGNAKAIEAAFPKLNFGAKLCMFGCANPNTTTSVKPFDFVQKELTVFGVLINPFTFPKALAFIELLGDRYLNYEKLGIKVFELHEYKQAIQSLREGKIAKATFKIHQG